MDDDKKREIIGLGIWGFYNDLMIILLIICPSKRLSAKPWTMNDATFL